MNNLKENILKKIEAGEVRKKPRWIFLSKKYSLWSFLTLSIFFGGISFSIFLYNYFDDLGPWYKLKSESSFWLSNIFWIWILFLILFILSAILNFRQTKKGFRIKLSAIIFGALFSTIFLGFGFYKIEAGKFLDRQILSKSKQYQEMKLERQKIIFDYLEKNNIDPKEFFENKKIQKLKEEYEEVDQQRIEKLKKILENSRGSGKEKEMRELFEKIKRKKREIDYLRFLKEIEIYQNK